MEDTYKNERQYNKVRYDEKKAKHDSILELSRRKERMRQNQSMRDYKRHIKELQQGFPEPKETKMPALTQKPAAGQAQSGDAQEDEQDEPAKAAAGQSPVPVAVALAAPLRAGAKPTLARMRKQRPRDDARAAEQQERTVQEKL